MNVSQEVVFRDVQRDGSGTITSDDVIPLQRNHLYRVVLTPKYNLGALEFEKIDYSIQVVDWQNGETIKFTRDANLTHQSTPNYIVEDAVSFTSTEVGYDGTHNPNRIYTDVNDCSIYIKVTSSTTGTMLESATFPSTQYGLVSSATTNDANGNLVETYKIDIDENIAMATDYTFRISNAINTTLYREFVVRRAPLISDPTDLQLGDVYYANGMWSRSEHYSICNSATPALGVVVYVNDGTATGDAVTEKDVQATGVGGHALVMALNDVDGSDSGFLWGGRGTDETNTYFPNETPYDNVPQDFKGLQKTNYLIGNGATGTCGHTHPFAQAINTWRNVTANKAPTDAAVNPSTDWFIASFGQWAASVKAMCEGVDGYYNGSTTYKTSWTGSWTSNNTAYGGANMYGSFYKALTNAGGNGLHIQSGEIHASGSKYWTSSEWNSESSISIIFYANGVGKDQGGGQVKDTNMYRVRPFLAF